MHINCNHNRMVINLTNLTITNQLVYWLWLISINGMLLIMVWFLNTSTLNNTQILLGSLEPNANSVAAPWFIPHVFCQILWLMVINMYVLRSFDIVVNGIIFRVLGISQSSFFNTLIHKDWFHFFNGQNFIKIRPASEKLDKTAR